MNLKNKTDEQLWDMLDNPLKIIKQEEKIKTVKWAIAILSKYNILDEIIRREKDEKNKI